jgi:hypothetical protein
MVDRARPRWPLSRSAVLRVAIPVGVVAAASSLWLQTQSRLSASDPLGIAFLIPLARGSPYVDIEAGLWHLAYVTGLSVLTGTLVFGFVSSVRVNSAFATGAVVGLINGLVAIPQAAAGGGLTGLFLLAPAALVEVFLIGFVSAACFVVLKRVTR